MTKDEIINEIRRIAEVDGKPPGMRKFENVSSIPKSKWFGIYWTKWSDALSDAGLSPNKINCATPTEVLAQEYLSLVEYLGHVPTEGEMRLRRQNTPNFASHNTFRDRLGKKNQLLKAVIEYAKDNDYPSKTISMLEDAVTPEKPQIESNDTPELPTGFVYLMKSGKHYKIGHTNSLDRRQYEIDLHLAEKIEPIHSIETDDPSGIEAYWHNRFKDKRMNGEWFSLTPSDVRIFKKRKFM